MSAQRGAQTRTAATRPVRARATTEPRGTARRRATLRLALLLGLGVVAVTASGCREVLTATLHLASDDLAIVSTLGEDGTLDAATLEESGVGPLPIREGDRAYAWVLAYGSFVALGGEPIPRPLAREVTVHVDDEARAVGHGDCGRCVLPSDVAPQALAAGDSCPIPAFARVVDLVASDGRSTPAEVPPAEVSALRRRIFLDWPGTCP